MPVKLRNMTPGEYEYFYQWSVEHQAAELMEELQLSLEEATKETVAEVAEMLPAGLNTEHHHLMTIVEGDTGENAGFIWTIHEETAGRKQSFVCDFTIWEPYRRKGYGTKALYLAENLAAEAGCQESVLFVRDNNAPAKALYQKCGYRILRAEGQGSYMLKPLL